mgnify:FL=1
MLDWDFEGLLEAVVAAEGTCGGSAAAAANVAEATAAADEDVVEVVEAGPGDFGASLTGGGCTGSCWLEMLLEGLRASVMLSWPSMSSSSLVESFRLEEIFILAVPLTTAMKLKKKHTSDYLQFLN